jgi:prepilin-type N-terminal cleavage/methylation domain-containing protein
MFRTLCKRLSTDRGFTLIELLVSATISLLVLAAAATTFKNALDINEAVTLSADSSQNLRAGTNMLVRDLLQAGRRIPTGGIPTPTGAGTVLVNRPSPPGEAYNFSTELDIQAVNPGPGLGPDVELNATDIVTILMVDMSSPLERLTVRDDPDDPPLFVAVDATGSSMTVPSEVPIGDQATGIKVGDLILFENALGCALQQVTNVSGQLVNFAAGDPFNLNQRSATEGSITQLLGGGDFSVARVLMITYYVDPNDASGAPRLMRMTNLGTPRALAGVVEDLKITYDLVDGVNNPTNLPTPVPPDNTPAHIRKVNLHVGVRSETRSVKSGDYIRQHINTQVSLRGLAFVDRYR